MPRRRGRAQCPKRYKHQLQSHIKIKYVASYKSDGLTYLYYISSIYFSLAKQTRRIKEVCCLVTIILQLTINEHVVVSNLQSIVYIVHKSF